MAVKQRPGSAKNTLSQQQATTRRGAPGKRFVGDRAEQSARAKEAVRAKVERMAEVDAAERTAASIEMPVSVILAELVQDAVKLARSLAAAPFRLAAALRRPREV